MACEQSGVSWRMAGPKNGSRARVQDVPWGLRCSAGCSGLSAEHRGHRDQVAAGNPAERVTAPGSWYRSSRGSFGQTGQREQRRSDGLSGQRARGRRGRRRRCRRCRGQAVGGRRRQLSGRRGDGEDPGRLVERAARPARQPGRRSHGRVPSGAIGISGRRELPRDVIASPRSSARNSAAAQDRGVRCGGLARLERSTPSSCRWLVATLSTFSP